jgi:hypothetical protein
METYHAIWKQRTTCTAWRTTPSTRTKWLLYTSYRIFFVAHAKSGVRSKEVPSTHRQTKMAVPVGTTDAIQYTCGQTGTIKACSGTVAENIVSSVPSKLFLFVGKKHRFLLLKVQLLYYQNWHMAHVLDIEMIFNQYSWTSWLKQGAQPRNLSRQPGL